MLVSLAWDEIDYSISMYLGLCFYLPLIILNLGTFLLLILVAMLMVSILLVVAQLLLY